MIALALVVSLTVSAEPAKKPAGGNETMKNLLKDATTVPTGGSDAKPAAKDENPPPDVEKMTFGPDSIKKVVAYYQPQIQGCYEETLAAKDKAVEGKISTSWVINADGLVKSAKVEKKGTTLKDQKLHDCVVAVLSAMSFPKPPDGKDQPVAFPFNLKAVH